MQIKVTYRNIFTGETNQDTIFDGTSPNGGYTQAHAEREAARWLEDRIDLWQELVSAEYI